MATIKISDLRSPLSASISCEEEFTGAVSNAVMRAIEARQLQDIRGGLTPTKLPIIAPRKPPIIVAGFAPLSKY